MAKILVVEDERDLVRLLKYNLEKEGHKVLECSDGESGLAAARKERPDLVVLDIMLPKKSGIDVCRALRSESSVPILFLTAKKSEVDRILGLRLGGDDYVTKPFSVGEVTARIDAILRRTTRGAGDVPVRIGALELDAARFEVRVGGRQVELTPKEFQFLKLLVEADGRVLSREDLLERVWGYDRSVDLDTRTIDQHVARLRKKLGNEGQRIATVTNAGYRLKRD